MKKSKEKTMKRYMYSSIITFISSFLVVLGNSFITLQNDMTVDTTWAVLAGLVITAGRAAVKIVWEKTLFNYTK